MNFVNKSGILGIGLKSILFQNNLPIEYNTKPNGKCPQNYSSFKSKNVYTVKQKLLRDNVTAESTVFMVHLEIQQARAPNDNT